MTKRKGARVAHKVVLVCDVIGCGRDDEVETIEFNIVGGTGPMKVDLCPEHRKPIEDLANIASIADQPTVRKARRPGGTVPIIDRDNLPNRLGRRTK